MFFQRQTDGAHSILQHQRVGSEPGIVPDEFGHKIASEKMCETHPPKRHPGAKTNADAEQVLYEHDNEKKRNEYSRRSEGE